MARQRLTIPFGGGLDRLSGHPAAEVTGQADLRNVHLAPGRMELRHGLEAATSIGWGTDVIGAVSVRKTGLLAVVVYDSATRGVRLYSCDGATASLVDTLWTIDATVAGHLPQVSLADVYDQIFIAHDERQFQYRGTTKVFDVTASSVSDLELDLDRQGAAAVSFRGVARHLAYLIGWGYGTASDPNRPETLRLSMPGEPLNFVPEHYFLVGAVSDPIVGVFPLGNELAVAKNDELWRLVGYDRQTFGVVPLDSAYGLLNGRLSATVAGKTYLWSPHGPRSTIGGPTTDEGAPLDLFGAAPDPSATPTIDGFAWFDPTEQEVIFCFGSWAYVLHLKDGVPRWSYRPFGRALASAAKLVTASGAGTLNLIYAEITSVTAVAPSYTPGDDNPKFSVVYTLSGIGFGTEKVEIWGRATLAAAAGFPSIKSKWTKLNTVSAVGGSPATVTVPYYLTDYDIAVRVVAGNTPGAGYTGTDPANWPATSRATANSGGAITTFELDGMWRRFGDNAHGLPLRYVGPGCTRDSNPELIFVYEESRDGGGSWQGHALGSYLVPLLVSHHTNADAHLAPDESPPTTSAVSVRYRLKVSGPSANAGFTSGTGDGVLAPAAPGISLIGADTGELAGQRHFHPVVTVAGANGPPVEYRVRHDPDGSWSRWYTLPNAGNDEALVLLDNTGGADDVRVEAVTHIGPDYSESTVQTASF